MEEELRQAREKLRRFKLAAKRHRKKMEKMNELAIEAAREVARLTDLVQDKKFYDSDMARHVRSDSDYNEKESKDKTYYTGQITLTREMEEKIFRDPSYFREVVRQSMSEGEWRMFDSLHV